MRKLLLIVNPEKWGLKIIGICHRLNAYLKVVAEIIAQCIDVVNDIGVKIQGLFTKEDK